LDQEVGEVNALIWTKVSVASYASPEGDKNATRPKRRRQEKGGKVDDITDEGKTGCRASKNLADRAGIVSSRGRKFDGDASSEGLVVRERGGTEEEGSTWGEGDRRSELQQNKTGIVCLRT